MHNKQHVGNLEEDCEPGMVAVSGEGDGVGAKQETTAGAIIDTLAHVTHLHVHNIPTQHQQNTLPQHQLHAHPQVHCPCQSHLQHDNERLKQHAHQQQLHHTNQKLLTEQGVSQLNPKRQQCVQEEHLGQQMVREHMYQKQQHVHDHCLPYQQLETQPASQDMAPYHKSRGHPQPQQYNHPQLHSQLSQVATKRDNMTYSHFNTFSQNPSIHHTFRQSTHHSNIPHSSIQSSDLNHISNLQPSYQLGNYHQSTSIIYNSKSRNPGLSFSLQELEKKKKDLEERLEEARARRRCVVCLDADYSALFMPCLHLVACRACAISLPTCPVCRTPIQYMFPVFID